MNHRKLGRGVALVGAGMSRFGSFPGKNSRDIFVEAYQDMGASVDKGFDPGKIEALYVGNYSSDLFESQGHIAPIMADWVNLTPCPAVRVEDACASSGVALREGIIAIASGLYDVVLVGGVEKMTGLPTERVTDTLATAADVVYEVAAGFTFPGFYAAMATAYMCQYNAPADFLLAVGMKNHENGAKNEKAQFGQRIADIMAARKVNAAKKGITVPTWADELEFLHDPRANPLIAWPLRLYDCSPISDGAAVLLLASAEIAHQFTDAPIDITGTGQASDRALHNRAALAGIPSAQIAARDAYQMAGLTPADIQVAEVHDCFTIAEIIASEDLGFFEPGEGWKAAQNGSTALTGSRPINTSGGLKSKGHPVGASGAGQVVEIWEQLRGQAGARQLPGNPRVGLTHNVGGTGQTCTVHVFERR
ncbi:MAG: beta-ketoacyl synthase N-terminal-like domain-containing protein [Anaerolineaceae bacterium]|nr:beta-ketoacyl synthase N-terminal-like domain-containing protein [Anaerolineaceae bacterium]